MVHAYVKTISLIQMYGVSTTYIVSFLFGVWLHAQTYFKHQETASAQENREYVLSEMCRALKTIAVVVDDDDLSKLNPSDVIVVPLAEEGEVERSLMFVQVRHMCTSAISSRSGLTRGANVGVLRGMNVILQILYL